MTVAMADDPEDHHAVDETLYERRTQAVSLRNAGMTFQQIANIQHISPAMVRRDVETALREHMSGQLDQIIAKHRSVLMDMQRANYGAMLAGGSNGKDAAAVILKGLEHEAKLLGLYAPTRVVTGVQEVEFSERFVQLVSLIKPDTLKELLRGANVRPEPDRPTDADSEPVDAEVVQLHPDGTAVATPPAGQADAPAPAGEQLGDGEPTTPGGEPSADDGGAPPDDDDDGWSNIGN